MKNQDLYKGDTSRALINATTESVFLIDRDGVILDLNEVLAKQMGRKLEDIIGTSVYDNIPQEVAMERKRRVAEVVASKKPLKLTDERGSTILDTTVFPILNTDGEVDRLAIFIKDITERKQIEEQIRFQSQIMEQIRDSVITVDMNGTITGWNHASYKLFNYTPEEAIGENISLVYPEESYDYLNQEIIPGLLSKKRMEIEVSLVRKDHTRFDALVSLSVLTDGEGNTNGMIGYTIDISARKRAEAALVEANATKDKFFSLLAHELKGPIGGVSDLLNIIKQKHASMTQEDLHLQISSCADTVSTTYALLEDLLTWSSSQRNAIKLKVESFNLKGFVEEIISLMIDLANRKEIALWHDIDDSLQVKADRNTTKTVMRNLLSNAIKFTPRGGMITVHARKSGGGHFPEVEIEVEDSGIGISEERISKLFRIASNISIPGTEKEKGTGLGLVICKEFVEKNGGRIWVESEEPGGSRFFFTLPSA